jgi:hypothetical protein
MLFEALSFLFRVRGLKGIYKAVIFHSHSLLYFIKQSVTKSSIHSKSIHQLFCQ